MAVRTTTTQEAKGNRGWAVGITLVVLFLAALFLRVYWNVDAAQEGGKFVLSGGSDPYYEKRAIDSIQANGYRTLIQDPLLNYPYGSINPNPPLYQWSVAVAGQLLAPFFHGDVGLATWWATEWAPAVYGALTLIPIYFIGKSLFDRRVGVLAAAFWVFSAEAIDVTGLGDSRHYAAVLFFATLAFLFYIKTLEQFRGDGNWVGSWKRGADVGSGIGRFFRERQLGLGYAFLTGISIAAVALMWKGFPYVIGILFLYAGLQMIVDHWRNRDSLGLWLATLIAMLVGMIVAYPYYQQAGVTNFLTASWYIVAAFFVAGLIMVPTRDMPTILVFPLALVIALVGVLVAFFVFPDVATSLLYSTVYFKQTSLYTTIAEAHPADFSSMAFGIGPLVFFLAIIGWFVCAFTLKRRAGRAILFAMVWGLVALYMAHSAVRFLFNAIPIFAVFGAFMTVWVVDWLDFGRIRKSLAANQGNTWQGLRKGTRPLHIVGVVLLALLLVIPNALFAADAAIPPITESKWRQDSKSAFVQDFVGKRLGAYGEGFLPGYWEDGLTWLDARDANTTNFADRPAFLSWWDYGHWAIAVGNHPTVADNFQNGYALAARFILAQNETEATQVMAARLIELPNANAEKALADAGSQNPAADRATLANCNYADRIKDCHMVNLDLAQSTALLQALETSTGKKIRYYAADVRMLPYDDPSTASIEEPSIYYAPVKLAEQNPDDYVTTKLDVGSGNWVTQEQYNKLLSDPTKRIGASAERLEYQQPFFNSMFYRAYVGRPVPAGSSAQPTMGDTLLQALNAPAPGLGLEHFRLVYANSALKMLEYYRGAVVEGTITQDGAPVSGVTVTAYDDAGKILLDAVGATQLSPEVFDVPHASVTTDAAGHYKIVAPFAMPGGNTTLVVSKAGTEIARAHLAITREDAEAQKSFAGTDIAIRPGNVGGIVYEDKDGDGAYTAANDTLVANATVTIGGKSTTTDNDGKYNLTGVPAGAQNVTVDDATRQVTAATRVVVVKPDQTATHDVALEAKPATLSGVVYADVDGDGAYNATSEGAGFVSVAFEADANATGNAARTTSAFTSSDGSFNTTLAPGTYLVSASYTTADGSTYKATDKLTLTTAETRSGYELKLVKTS